MLLTKIHLNTSKAIFSRDEITSQDPKFRRIFDDQIDIERVKREVPSLEKTRETTYVIT